MTQKQQKWSDEKEKEKEKEGEETKEDTAMNRDSRSK